MLPPCPVAQYVHSVTRLDFLKTVASLKGKKKKNQNPLLNGIPDFNKYETKVEEKHLLNLFYTQNYFLMCFLLAYASSESQERVRYTVARLSFFF